MSGTLIFFIIIFAITVVARLGKHGMDLERRRIEMRGVGGGDVAALERENAMLRSKLERLEGRTAVLERIATDSPARLTAEIEKLRD